MLNSRELASLIWLGLFLGFALTKRDVRSSFLTVIKMLADPKIAIPAIAYVTCIAALVWGAMRVGLWSQALLAATLLWFVFAGLALFFKLNEAGKDKHFFRKTALATLGVGAFIEFFVNIKTFSLPVELILAPIITLLVGVQIVAKGNREHAAARRLVEGLLGVIGVVLLSITIIDLARNWEDQDPTLLWQSLALPVWLTVGALPLIYLLSLYSGYELAFRHMELRNNDKKPSLRSRLAVLVGLRGRVRNVNAFAGFWPGRVVEQQHSFSKALEQVREFKRDRARREAEAREEVARIKRYTGVDGVDESGRRLDQREFEETKDALRWLATCQMGWYQNHGRRYRPELLEMMAETFSLQHLPDDHGIVMQVKRNGQAWYAWRRTVTGWVFAIGSARKPPDEWLYDGPEPPSGFPGADHSWGDNTESTRSMNW